MEKRTSIRADIDWSIPISEKAEEEMESNAKIYVAGAGGVAGSAIVRLLQQQRYMQLLLPSHGDLDLTNQADVETFFQRERPDYVFFTAVRMGSILYRNEHPADILFDNLAMQSNAIRAAHEYGTKKLLFMSSDFIYPDTDSGILREEDFLSGQLPQKDRPYTLAKIEGIKLCDYYRQQYGDDFFTVVPCAFFGINSSFDLQRANVIGALIRRFHEAKCNGTPELVLWGSGKPVKEFLYCDDVAQACLFLMNQRTDAGIFNIGAGTGGISIMEAAQTVRKVVGFKGEITCDLSKPDGMMRRVMDSNRLRKLGWQPQHSFEQAVELTYQHFLTTEYAHIR